MNNKDIPKRQHKKQQKPKKKLTCDYKVEVIRGEKYEINFDKEFAQIEKKEEEGMLWLYDAIARKWKEKVKGLPSTLQLEVERHYQ